MPKKSRKTLRRSGGSKRKHTLAYALLAALLICLVVYLFTHLEAPSFLDDDTTYELLASMFSNGQTSFFIPPYSARLLQIIPIAAFYKLMGVNLVSNAMWDITSTLILVLITFFIGKELYNEYAGLLAAFFLSLIPIINTLAASGNETIPMAMFASLAVLSFIKGYSRNSSLWYLAAGVSIFASFLASPLGVVIGVVIVVYMLIMKIGHGLNKTRIKITRKSLGIVWGIALSALLLALFDYLISGNPLHILSVSLGFVSAHFIAPVAPTPYYETLLLPKLGPGAPSMINANAVFFYLSLIASAYLLLKRSKAAYLPAFWLLFGMLYLLAGPMYVGLFPPKYSVIPQEWRFLTMLAVPMALLPAIFLVKLTEEFKKHKPYILIAVAVVILLLAYVSAAANNLNYQGYLISMRPQLHLASYLNALPNSTTIYLPVQLPWIVTYMHFDNLSRFKGYSEPLQNCTSAEKYDYTITTSNLSSGSSGLACTSLHRIGFLQNKTVISGTGLYLYRSG